MPAANESPELKPYALYRYFDVRDILLYVGISGDLAGRERTHIAKSKWMSLAIRSTIERYGSLAEAGKAEREAIKAGRPIFNKQHNDTPEARERLRAYLEDIGRLDLLSLECKEATPPFPVTGPAQIGPRLPRGIADVYGWPCTPEPLPTQFGTDTYHIEIRHGRDVTLHLSSGALITKLPLDAELAWQLGDALKRHAEEVFMRKELPA